MRWNLYVVINGLKNKRLLRTINDYKKAVAIAEELHKTTGKNYTVETPY